MLVYILCIVLSFLGISNSGSTEDYNQLDAYVRTQFINGMPIYLGTQNISGLSPQCDEHYEQYRKSLMSGKKENVWAFRMRDAQSKFPSGVLDGNLVDLGSFDECINIEASLSQSNNIFGKYCLGTFSISMEDMQMKTTQLVVTRFFDWANFNTRNEVPSDKQIIQLATCLPHSCSAADIQLIYSDIGIAFKEELCQTKSSQPELDRRSIVTLFLLGLVFCIMVASTVYDVMLYYQQKKPDYSLLIAFSVLTNGRAILATSKSPSQISCLHGIRAISTLWIILFHRYNIQSLFPASNSLDIYKWMQSESSMFILGGTVAVDTFFVMSGLVVSYSFMSAAAKKIKFNIIRYYIHRYLRLTPVLAVIILIHITFLRQLGSGPLWPQTIQSGLIDNCDGYWWRGLLYIQNYGDPAKCVPQSWYLSVDMQLFLLSPLILIPLSKWPKSTLTAVGFLTVCSIISCFLISWFLEIKQYFLPSINPEKYIEFFVHYYYATYTRAASWLIGIILGYTVFVCKQRKTPIIISNKMLFFIWPVALGILCTCVFAGHETIFGEYDRFMSALYLSLNSSAWSVALSCIILVCVIGYGGPVNWFLSLPIFEITSKLTYTLYLTHYTLIYLTTAQMRSAPRFSNPQMMYAFWGDLAFTAVVSLVLTLAFELPAIKIDKVLFESTTRNEIRPELPRRTTLETA